MKEKKKSYNSPVYFAGMAAMLIIMFIGPYVVPAWSEEITQTGVAVTCDRYSGLRDFFGPGRYHIRSDKHNDQHRCHACKIYRTVV